MPSNRLHHLFHRYLNREIAEEELRELMQLVQQPGNEPAVKALLDQVWEQLAIDHRLPAHKADAVFNAILAANPNQSVPVIPMPDVEAPQVHRLSGWKRLSIAAAILLLVTAGALYFFINKPAPPVAVTNTQHFANDLPPGTNNAMLMLADGRRINLDSAANGNLAQEEQTVIRKTNGQISYDVTDRQLSIGNRQLPMSYNMVSTARGNQYKLILPDGSAVWLNAESSVRFPVAFNGKERRVEVTGEVYLQVKHNAGMPFTVVANGVEVHDLGTEFNINAYANEDGVKTTVVEGKVQVVKGKAASENQRTIVTPGQQAIVSDGSASIKLVKDADVESAIAWKNGQFMFSGISIQAVMRQLERWYDIEVSYAPNISKEEYIGTMTRFANISSVLQMLEKTGTVHFEIKGRKVLVK